MILSKVHLKEFEDHSAPTPQEANQLNTVVFPALDKLLSDSSSEAVVAALEGVRSAFVEAERNRPGITKNLLHQIIETLKQ